MNGLAQGPLEGLIAPISSISVKYDQNSLYELGDILQYWSFTGLVPGFNLISGFTKKVFS